MLSKTIKQQSDWFGAAASALCLIHCLATPFIFVAKTCSSAACCHSSPLWWSAIDGLFAVVSFAAICWTAQRTQLRWMIPLLYGVWGLLMLVLLNDKLGWYTMGAWAYVPALLLVALHLYNHRHCSCHDIEGEKGLCQQ